MSRIDQQFGFLVAADRLKTVNRATALMDGSRRENAAECHWHIALWLLTFADPAHPGAIRMALLQGLHDDDADATADPFALLPSPDQAALRALARGAQGDSPAAAALRRHSLAQPVFQDLGHVAQTRTDHDVLISQLSTGQPATLADDWPAIHARASALLSRTSPPHDPDLDARLRFLAEADRLKTVLRATSIFDGSRRENSAEHSWHLALFALVLSEYAIRPVDTDRVIAMLILHDLVEIDAGDAPIHGASDKALQAAEERRAADRLFGLLPAPQAVQFRTLWDEFESAQSDDAVFAKALDRVQPVLANLATNGGTWPEYNVTRDQLQSRVGDKVRRGAPALWDALSDRIDGWFAV